MKRPRQLTPERQAELKRRYMAGEKQIVIQHEMGICRTTIERYVYRLALPLRQPWQAKVRNKKRRLFDQRITQEARANDQTPV
jgi:hypothetical protein